MLQHLITQFLLYNLLSGRLWKVKNKRKIQISTFKSGRSCLLGVVACKMFKTFGILD